MHYRLFCAVASAGIAATCAASFFSITTYHQPASTTFYMERLAKRVERASTIASETETAVMRVVNARHRSRVEPYQSSQLESRQRSAVSRIELAMRDKVPPLKQLVSAN
jgi:hypothetical protein